MRLDVIDKIDEASKKFKNVFNSGVLKFSKLDEWLYKESTIYEKEIYNYKKIIYPKFRRGEIVKVDFGVNIGSELSHTHFAIVLNSDDSIYNDNITVLPITSKSGYRKISLGKILNNAIPNTNKYNLNSYGYLTQIKTISKYRLFVIKFKYICDNIILDKIDSEIIKYLTNIHKNN